MNRRSEGVRLTHLPTGIVAQSRDCAPRRCDRPAWYERWARRLLLARLCHVPERPPIRRTYDLSPLGDIPPHIRQDGRRLATGNRRVAEILDGNLDRLEEDK